MASKPKRAIITNTKKKPVTPPKAAKPAKPRRKRQPQRAWWDVLLDFIGNFILLVLASALILGLAQVFRGFFDWLL